MGCFEYKKLSISVNLFLHSILSSPKNLSFISIIFFFGQLNKRKDDLIGKKKRGRTIEKGNHDCIFYIEGDSMMEGDFCGSAISLSSFISLKKKTI